MKGKMIVENNDRALVLKKIEFLDEFNMELN